MIGGTMDWELCSPVRRHDGQISVGACVKQPERDTGTTVGSEDMLAGRSGLLYSCVAEWRILRIDKRIIRYIIKKPNKIKGFGGF